MARVSILWTAFGSEMDPPTRNPLRQSTEPAICRLASLGEFDIGSGEFVSARGSLTSSQGSAILRSRVSLDAANQAVENRPFFRTGNACDRCNRYSSINRIWVDLNHRRAFLASALGR